MSTDDRILEAALAVVEEEGLRGATTRRIAEHAQVNEVTLFRRFGSKDQLLCEAFRRRAAERGSGLPEDPVDPEQELTAWVVLHSTGLHRARRLIRSTLTEMQSHPTVCTAAHAGPRKVTADLVAYLERLRARGLARGSWDAEAATRMLMGALFGEIVAGPMLETETTPEPAFDPDQLARRYVPLVLRAIGAETRGSE
jgi:AcrR family transcriptional regulator